MTSGAGGRPATATVLFTDLVGSTALRQAVGDDIADELRRSHDRVLRGAVARHGGQEVKGTGDGLMVVFDSAVEAVAAAEAMQRGVDRLNRRAPAPVAIRVGLSAGDVLWEGDDCFGMPVVEACRLCDRAGAAQILVGDVVRVLAGSRGAHEFRPIGALELKGLAHALPAAEVVWQTAEEPVPLPAPLAGTAAVGFVGRVEELKALWTAWKRAGSGDHRLVLVSGEPGVGKTRLANELAQRAHAEGATVLFGRCDEDLAVPYQPFVEALHTYVDACTPADLEFQVGQFGGDVARLVPELARRIPGLPEPLRADPETERYRLFDAVKSLLEEAAELAPVVVILDDLHWAAKPTLLMLRHLVRAPNEVPLLVVGTCRDTELDHRHPLAAMVADLRQDDLVARINLGGLHEGEVTQFVEAAADPQLGPRIARLARMVYAETDGNPFFVGQLLRHLVESGAAEQRDRDAAHRIGIPEGVREVITRRLARLDDDTNAVLAVAAVIGREFDPKLLAEATEFEKDRVLDALESAEAGRLIQATPGTAQFTFVHALVRSTLYDEIPTTRRLRLHQRVARALERRVGRDDSLLPSLARHYCVAAALGDTEKAVHYATAAAQGAFARLSYEEAADLYERALAVLEQGGYDDRDHLGDLLIGLATARRAAGDPDGARQAALRAAEHGRQIGRPEILADAVLTLGWTGRWNTAGAADDALVAVCEDALELLPSGDARKRAIVSARLASELYLSPGTTKRRRALIDEAIATARELDDPATLGYVLNNAHWGVWIPGTARERLALAEEVVKLGRAAGSRDLEFSGAWWAFCDDMELGDTDGANEMLTLEITIATELNQPIYLWNARAHQSARALMDGRYDDAERLADEALAHGQAVPAGRAMQFYAITHNELGRARGGLEALIPLFQGGVEQYPNAPVFRAGLANLYSQLDRRDEAREQFEVSAATDFADLPTDANWPVAMAGLIAACARLGDRERAIRLYEMFEPYGEYHVVVGAPAISVGSAEGYLALAAGTAGHWDVADEHFAEALEANERSGNRPHCVHITYEYGRLLARRDEAGARPRLRELLRECLAGATDMSMSRVVDQTRSLADTAGVTLD